jgi:hypothetical protein
LARDIDGVSARQLSQVLDVCEFDAVAATAWGGSPQTWEVTPTDECELVTDGGLRKAVEYECGCRQWAGGVGGAPDHCPGCGAPRVQDGLANEMGEFVDGPKPVTDGGTNDSDWQFDHYGVLVDDGERWWHVTGRFERADSGARYYRLQDGTHTNERWVHADDAEGAIGDGQFESLGWSTRTKPASQRGFRVNGVLCEPARVLGWLGQSCASDHECESCGESTKEGADIILDLWDREVDSAWLRCQACGETTVIHGEARPLDEITTPHETAEPVTDGGRIDLSAWYVLRDDAETTVVAEHDSQQAARDDATERAGTHLVVDGAELDRREQQSGLAWETDDGPTVLTDGGLPEYLTAISSLDPNGDGFVRCDECGATADDGDGINHHDECPATDDSNDRGPKPAELREGETRDDAGHARRNLEQIQMAEDDGGDENA